MAELPLHSFLAERGQMVEAALHRCVAGLAGIVPDELHAALGNGVIGSGKRLRPLLLVTACEELGGDIGETLYDLSVSVEAIHAYSLLHDDLPCMDDAALRRGRPTVHVAHGVRAATVAGGVLIPWAAAWAFESALRSGCGEDAARRIVLLLLEAAGAGGMIGGQAMDLLAEGRSLAEEELERLHGMKTGALLAASLEIGAVAAGAGDDDTVPWARSDGGWVWPSRSWTTCWTRRAPRRASANAPPTLNMASRPMCCCSALKAPANGGAN